MIIRIYTNKGLSTEMTTADDIEHIVILDEESEEIIKDITI